jgi:hypothetical protein
MHQDECAPPALRHQVRSEDCLANAGGCHEYAGVVLEEGSCGGLLDRRELAVKSHVQLDALVPLVLERELHLMLVQKHLEVELTAARDGEVLREVLRAGDDPGRAPRGQPHSLLLVELRVLKGGEPLHLVEQRRRYPGLPDEEPLRQDHLQLGGERASDPRRARTSRRKPRPRRRVLLFRDLRCAYADNEPVARRLARKALDQVREDPRNAREIRPLVRPGLEGVVEEHRVALLAGPGTAACGWFSAVTGLRGEVPWRSSNPQRYFDGTGRASAASGLARAEFAAMAALLSIARSSA